MKMKIKLICVLMITTGVLISCDNLKNNKRFKKSKIDYTNKTVLDSLIKSTPKSTDTLFLGFTFGMTKSDYRKQIQKLRDEGKKITYSKSNIFKSLVGTFELGKGYTFQTAISMEKFKKSFIGTGNFFLEPSYNEGGNLIQLTVLPIEKWDNEYGFTQPKWLESKIKENSEIFNNKRLKQALIDNKIINSNNFIRKKGGLIIYERTPSIIYTQLNALYIELLINANQKDLIKKKTQDIKF